MKNLNFGQAIEALKKGKKVSREGWNEKGLFVFMQVPSIINQVIVPKMQSLPQSVKDEFERRFNDPNEQIDSIYYDNQLALVNLSNLITGWSPSTSDALAEDWIVLDNEEQTSITDEERIGKPLSELFVILEDLAKSQKTLYGNNSESVKLTNVAIEELMEAEIAIKIAFKLQ